MSTPHRKSPIAQQRRAAGHLSIAEHGIIGDLGSAGRYGWDDRLVMPRAVDGPSVFGSLLDRGGASFRIAPVYPSATT
jgi:hypothetical protein